MKEYLEFLKKKIAISENWGFDIKIPLLKFNDGTELKPHQRDAIEWAIKGGKRALFESFGLGKTMRLKSRNWYLWDDVTRMFTLNSEQSKRNLMNHICPLQFDIVDRIINRFSNKGEWVYDPFGGLMTVPYRAVKFGRKGRADELNSKYFIDGSRYMEAIESEIMMPTLFDMIEM